MQQALASTFTHVGCPHRKVLKLTMQQMICTAIGRKKPATDLSTGDLPLQAADYLIVMTWSRAGPTPSMVIGQPMMRSSSLM